MTVIILVAVFSAGLLVFCVIRKCKSGKGNSALLVSTNFAEKGRMCTKAILVLDIIIWGLLNRQVPGCLA